MSDETATITKGRGFIRIHASEELLAGLGHPEMPELTIGDFHQKWHKALLLPDSYEIERVEQIKGHHGERDVFHIFVQHEAIPVIGDYEPMRKVSIASMLAQHMDWLQFDVNGVNENVVQAHTRQALALSEIKADVRYVWIVLLAVAAFLLVVAVMLGVVVYQLGILIGHIR